MKEVDPLFKALFREIYHSGSYYDGLRVGDPREFDLNLLLDLSIFKDYFIVEKCDEAPGADAYHTSNI
jgi:hypothetical protein